VFGNLECMGEEEIKNYFKERLFYIDKNISAKDANNDEESRKLNGLYKDVKNVVKSTVENEYKKRVSSQEDEKEYTMV
jgi:hypothetical protein